MEILIEIIGEVCGVFFDVLEDTVRSKKIPLLIRIIMSLTIGIVLIIGTVWVSLAILESHGIIGAIVCCVIGFVFFALWLFWFFKKLKSYRQ